VVELRAVGEDQPPLQPAIVHLVAVLVDEGHQIVEAVPQLHRVVDLPREGLQVEPLNVGFYAGLPRVVVVRRSRRNREGGAVAVVHAEKLLGRVRVVRHALEELPRVLEHWTLWEVWEIMVGRRVRLRQ
jgi:hypothetical protein